MVGSVGSSRRKQCGSVRNAEANTRASRRSSFAPAWRETVAEAVELLRVERVDGDAVLHQALDHRPARRLDRHADIARRARRERQQPVRHLRQARPAVLEHPLPEHLPASIGYAHLMLLRTPVDTHEPSCLQPEPPRLADRTGAPSMPAGPCTGALRRKLPTGCPSMAGCGGTSPKEVLDARGDSGSSPQPARLHATNRARSRTAYRVTRRPPRGSDGSYGPCGPAWTRASRPSTTSRGPAAPPNSERRAGPEPSARGRGRKQRGRRVSRRLAPGCAVSPCRRRLMY